MKFGTLLFLIFLWICVAIQPAQAQCPPNTQVFIRYQQDADAFLEDYPNCTELSSLKVQWAWNQSTTQATLQGLSNIKSIGTLTIVGNGVAHPMLSGFKNLEKVRRLRISNAPILINIDSFLNLREVEDLYFFDCTSLESISEQVDFTISEKLQLISCSSLKDLGGINCDKNLETVQVTGCNTLIRLDLLDSLKTVNELILSQVDDLSFLNQLEKAAEFNLNGGAKVLPDLEGAEFSGSVLLSNLRGIDDLGFFSGLKFTGSFLSISDCSFQHLNDLLLDENVMTYNIYLSSLSELNDLSFLQPVSHLDELELVDLPKVDDFSVCRNLIDLGYLNLSSLPNLDNLEDFQNIKRLGDFRVFDTNIASFMGLSSLEELGRLLYIIKNSRLKSLDGFESLLSFNKDSTSYARMCIIDNPLLFSLADFPSVEGVLDFIELKGNKLLYECDTDIVCDYLEGPLASFSSISGNKEGCLSREQILEDCNTATSIKEEAEVETLQVYPNPTSSTVFIKGMESYELKTWELISRDGTIVMSGQGSGIDVSGMMPGLYLLKVGEHTQRVVIAH